MEKLSAKIIKAKLEELNLEIKDASRIFKIDVGTLKKWTENDYAPYYFVFSLKYLEDHLEELRPQKVEKKGHNSAKPRNLSLSKRFNLHTKRLENGCINWTSKANSVRIDGKFPSPRQAAWQIKFGEKPNGELKTRCGNEKCVNVEHLEISTKRSSGRKFISEELKNLIRFELSKENPNQKAIAATFKVSAGTVSRIANEKN